MRLSREKQEPDFDCFCYSLVKPVFSAKMPIFVRKTVFVYINRIPTHVSLKPVISAKFGIEKALSIATTSRSGTFQKQLK